MYDVFISYCSKDIKQVEEICKILDSNGLTYWFAPTNMHGDRDFTDEIPKAIKNSKSFLLLLSKSAQESKWVQRELGFADKYNIPKFTLFLNKFKLTDQFDFVLNFNHHYSLHVDKENAMEHLINDLKGKAGKSDTSSVTIEKLTIKRKSPVKIIAIALAVILILTGAFVVCRSLTSNEPEYVIWCPSYDIALSGNAAQNINYLAGEALTVKNDRPAKVPDSCVWQISFESDNTVIISRNGSNLGVEPGYKGVGVGTKFSADRWQMVEVGDGLFCLENTETKTYLEWYPEKNNWANHEIIGNKRDQFLLRLDKVS